MKIITFIKNFIIDPDRKSFRKILSDLWELRSSGFMHYFTCLMYKKNSGPIHFYLNRNTLIKIISEIYRTEGEHPILQNKNRFREYMIENKIPIAKSLGKINNGTLYIYENNVKYSDISTKEMMEILISFTKGCALFIKKVDGEGGKSVYKISSTKNNDVHLDPRLEYIVEYEILQHPDVALINPNCINTLRVISVNIDGDILIPDSFFRMGTGDSFVDNGSSGGIFTQYNLDNNKLDKVAYKLIGSGGNSYYYHPNTNIRFEGHELPYPEKVKELVTNVAKLFPDKLIVGWDVAYTPEGPIILEGNDNSHIGMMQISAKGLLNNEIYKDVFKKYI